MGKFSMLRRMSDTGRRTGLDVALTAAFVALVVIGNVILYSFCAMFSWYFWVDDDARLTVGNATEAYFAAINPEKEEITVWFCMPEETLRTNQTNGRVLDTVEQFAEKYDFIKIDYANIFTDYTLVKKWAEQNNTEINEYSVVVTCGDRSVAAAIETFYVFLERDNAARLEYNGEETMATLVNLAVNGHKEREAALITVGHGEEATVSAFNLLASAGYSIGNIDLSEQEIPPECSLLLISEPKYDFEDYSDAGAQFVSEVDRLEAFLKRGGTLIVLRSPEAKSLPNLDRFLAENGLIVNSDSVLQDNQSGVGSGGYTLLVDFAEGAFAQSLEERVRTFNATRTVVGKASPIRLGESGNGREVFPILKTAATASEVKEGETLSSGAFTVMAASVTTYGESLRSHLILASSGDVLAYEMMETDGYANEELMYALLEKAEGRAVPIGCKQMTLNAHPLENLTIGETHLYFVLLAAVIPLLVGGVGIFVCRRRKYR